MSQSSSAIDVWKKEHFELSKKVGSAAKILGKIQENFLEETADIIINNDLEGFILEEFLMNYGQQMIQLNHMLAVFSQLGSPK